MVKISAAAVGLALISCVNGGAVTTGAPQNPIVAGGECVRMFHSKGDVGCFSLDKDGTRARLVAITKAEDFVQSKLQEESIVVLPDSLFTKENLAQLNGEWIKGVMVYPTNSSATFNYEVTTPQGKGTVDGGLNPAFGDYVWNPKGRGIMAQSLPYPIIEVESEASVQPYLDMARKNDNTGTGNTFGVVFKGLMEYYFGPSKMDSISCLNFKNIYGERSPKCLPVGGQSAWAVKGDLSIDKPLVVAMAPMDTTAFSQVYAPGANAGASSLVALLAAADALKSIASTSLKKHIVFAAFQAESYGFVGSRRFLADLQASCATTVKSATPFGTSFCASPITSTLAFKQISLAKIDAAIAIDQVGQTTNDKFYLHLNPKATKLSNSSILQWFTNAPSAKGNFNQSSVEAIPPGPLTSFLNDKEYGNASLVSAVLTGYDSAFMPTYHSRADTNNSIQADKVVQAAQVLAEALFTAAAVPGTAVPSTISVNATLVADLMNCITSNWRCGTMKAYSKLLVTSMNDYLDFSDSSIPSYMQPVHLYTSVYSENRMPTIRVNKTTVEAKLDQPWQDSFKLNLYPNAYETFTRAFLAASVADPNDSPKSCSTITDCGDDSLDCIYPGVCVRRSAYFHDALSPGLEREVTYGLYKVVNESMPLWTEPNWGTLGTLVYPDPGNTIGYVTLGSGVVSIGLGYILSSRFLAHFRKQKLL
ncbi:hypothetical protein LEN26_015746 [Aphanomyces euteiches]|nr:hypothetical protein LEN26_015746 [Aphanomyces euteiches]